MIPQTEPDPLIVLIPICRWWYDLIADRGSYVEKYNGKGGWMRLRNGQCVYPGRRGEESEE